MWGGAVAPTDVQIITAQRNCLVEMQKRWRMILFKLLLLCGRLAEYLNRSANRWHTRGNAKQNVLKVLARSLRTPSFFETNFISGHHPVWTTSRYAFVSIGKRAAARRCLTIPSRAAAKKSVLSCFVGHWSAPPCNTFS